MARVLAAAFFQHLHRGKKKKSGVPCMCMYHLHGDLAPEAPPEPVLWQICGVWNAAQAQLYMLANPRISGGSKAVIEREERSVRTGQTQTVKRTLAVFVDYTDPETDVGFYRLWQGDAALCLQQAMEEMNPPKRKEE